MSSNEASPTLGCSIEILRDIYTICMYVGFSTIVYGKPIQKNCMLKCVGRITYSKHAHSEKTCLKKLMKITRKMVPIKKQGS